MPILPISYTCRAVESGKFIKMIWFATQTALAIMFVLILAGMPTLLIMIVFTGTLFVLIDACLFHATYTLDENGIMETLLPSKSPLKLLKPKQRQFKWAQIKSYLLDEEMTRSHGPQKFLRIHFHKSRYTVLINEGYADHQKKEFQAFAQAFVEKVPQSTALELGFYSKPIAKVLTLIFLFAAITLTVLSFVMPLGFGGIFRLSIVIIPGTLYMVYRSFIVQKQKS